MFDIDSILNDLSKKRPVFHSEADFQHALAWEIHLRFPRCKLRLEYKPKQSSKPIYVDIWAEIDNYTYPIELKYKTCMSNLEYEGEYFDLTDQVAYPIGRYDFLYDLSRLEGILRIYENTIGYAIFLTNDNNYWNPPKKSEPIDLEFKIHQSRAITGTLTWDKKTSIGTKNGRESPIILNGVYKLNWYEYSKITNEQFRYLLLEVKF